MSDLVKEEEEDKFFDFRNFFPVFIFFVEPILRKLNDVLRKDRSPDVDFFFWTMIDSSI